MDIVIGTAGHIDHGKTAIVKALTGVDADRLPEEKQRGITIDLGFAELKADGLRISFVDVPGHERFVKNMLAGAGGIDAVMLVVAADEGVMPQTREHFEICRLLETKRGMVVLTKSDLVDDEFADLVELDVAELVEGSFLESAPVIRTSSKTGAGLDALREALSEMAAALPGRDDLHSTRLPVDRSFSVKGFGAVVTGTLTAGAISVGDEMELLPVMKQVRVRGLQSHSETVERAEAGRRTAVNLGGIDHASIERGMVLAETGAFTPTQIIDSEIEVLSDAAKPLRSRQRVRVHIGTAEALARIDVLEDTKMIEPGGRGLVQVRLESPVTASAFDRFIIRSYSPQVTIAGGRVLDPLAKKHKRKDLSRERERLLAMSSVEGDAALLVRIVVESASANGMTAADVVRRTGLKAGVVRDELRKLAASGDLVEAEKVFLPAAELDELRTEAIGAVESHHASDPLSPGMPREALRDKLGTYLPEEVFKAVLGALESESSIIAERDIVKLASHSRDLKS